MTNDAISSANNEHARGVCGNCAIITTRYAAVFPIPLIRVTVDTAALVLCLENGYGHNNLLPGKF